MSTGLSSKTSRAGDTFSATVTDGVRSDRGFAIPVGTVVEGHVTSVEPAKRLSRSGTIAVDFDRLAFADGRSVPIAGQLTSLDPEQRRAIDAEEGEIQGSSTTKRNVLFIGGGAGAGAVIGAVSGSTGAGAGVGAGLGAAAVLLSKGNEAEIQPGFEFGLELLREVRIPGRGTSGFDTRDDLLYVQSILHDRDSYAGPVDGRMSSTFQAALRRYQNSNGLTETGRLDDATARAMGLVDERGVRGVALKPIGLETQSGPNGSLDVTVAAQARTGGWSVFEHHFVSSDTLHVYLRGVPPDGPATQALTRQEVRFTVPGDTANALARYVVHGEGADLTGQLVPAGGTPDLGDLGRRVNLMLTGYERSLGVRSSRNGGTVFSGRGYTEPEVELYFALNSLASSMQLYNVVAPGLRDRDALHGAAQVIVRAARQVDRAVGRAGTNRTTGVERDWSGIRADFASLAESIGVTLDRDER